MGRCRLLSTKASWRPRKRLVRLRPARSAVALALSTVLLAAAAGAAAQPASGGWLDRPLADALEDLRRQGLRLIYSSDLVKPELQVAVEPSATTLHRRLEELLAPHGLAAEVGPSGHLLVVRKPGESLHLSLVAPRPGQVTAGEVEVEAMVSGLEPVERLELYVNGLLAAQLLQPPWRTILTLIGGAPEWRLEAVARGAWGGRTSASIVTRNVVIEEEMEVALRRLHVTAVMRRGSFVDLRPEEVEVFEDGVSVEVASLDRGGLPLALTVVLDSSASMAGEPLTGALGATRALLRRLEPADRAMVLLFSDRVQTITPFSKDHRSLEGVLDGVKAHGGTALTDHLYAALELLREEEGRRAVFLVSDGADVLSALSMEDVRWRIDRSDAVIYWLRLGGGRRWQSYSSAWRGATANLRELRMLERAVGATGGRVIDLEGAGELAEALDEVLEEIRGQYALYYRPLESRPDGSWRSVEVRASRPGIRLRYRPGYFDERRAPTLAKDSPAPLPQTSQ